jgi:hypothetical protein
MSVALPKRLLEHHRVRPDTPLVHERGLRMGRHIDDADPWFLIANSLRDDRTAVARKGDVRKQEIDGSEMPLASESRLTSVAASSTRYLR